TSTAIAIKVSSFNTKAGLFDRNDADCNGFRRLLPFGDYNIPYNLKICKFFLFCLYIFFDKFKKSMYNS
ncbi:MAG TPA: hypothetical protein DCY31_02910, partial [Ruminococcaceae bacterium]|nr:hypothetical protein [Oscillospiraceae bacterium]